jgi:hypothetical protein
MSRPQENSSPCLKKQLHPNEELFPSEQSLPEQEPSTERQEVCQKKIELKMTRNHSKEQPFAKLAATFQKISSISVK